MALSVPFKIAGAGEGSGARRAGDLGLAVYGERRRGGDGGHGKPGVVPRRRVHDGIFRRTIRRTIRRSVRGMNAAVSGCYTTLTRLHDTRIGIRDTKSSRMFLASNDSLIAMIPVVGVRSRKVGLEMCCDVLSKRRFARAGDLTAIVETYVHGSRTVICDLAAISKIFYPRSAPPSCIKYACGCKLTPGMVPV